MKCKVHRLSNTVEDVFLPLEDDISGVIRLQPSLQHANAMGTFRKALRDVIVSSLEFSFGRPDNADKAYSQACMSVFLPGNTKSERLSRFLIAAMFNSDWTDHSSCPCLPGLLCRP